MQNLLLALPRPVKRGLVLGMDAVLCVLTVWVALALRLGEWVPLTGPVLPVAGLAVALALPIFAVSGLYRAIFRYSGWPALLAVAQAVGIYGVLFAVLVTLIGIPGVPRTMGIIQPMLLLLLVGASRGLARLWLGQEYLGARRQASRPQVLIYGAGESGRQLAAAFATGQDMQLAGFLDDDESLHGHMLNGHPVYSPTKLPDLVASMGVRDVLLALPGLSRGRRNEVLDLMRKARVSVRTIPSLNDLAQGRVTVSDLRELDLDDLLGREPVAPNPGFLAKNITSKVVLVTGAGGSIGSELCRQIVTLRPQRLLLVENYEFGLYQVHQELERGLGDRASLVLPLLASVQDAERMNEIMRTWRPHTVYHAAAYKHVPLVEHNPAEGLRNNVLGTLRAAQAALAHGVENFVLVSTDKAVRPSNVMGASKRLAELVLQALAAEQPQTCLSMVRFGNVLGSSGSVVPRFRQQIRDGGPITITHPEITRYFMTIPEAAQLVLQAGAMARGGEVFVLDMGAPVRILELARRMVELSGLAVRDPLNPQGDIAIEITGLRPGEKLYEELLIGDDPSPTSHPRILKARDNFHPWHELQALLAALELALADNDVPLLRSLLAHLVSGYTPNSAIVDWVYLEQEAALTRRLPGFDLGETSRDLAHSPNP